MRRTKLIALSIPIELLKKIDETVLKNPDRFRSRSHAFSLLAASGLDDFEQGKELKEFVNKLFGG